MTDTIVIVLISCSLAGNIVAIGLGIAAIAVRPRMPIERLAKVEHDLSNVRMQINVLPTEKSMHGVEVKMAELWGEVKGVRGEAAATNRAVERIEAFLIKATADSIVRRGADEGAPANEKEAS